MSYERGVRRPAKRRPVRRSFLVRLDEKQHAAIARRAALMRRATGEAVSLSDVVRDAIDRVTRDIEVTA